MPKIIQVRNFYDISSEEWRVLKAVETGMRNHEYVDLHLIHQFAGISFNGGSFAKILKQNLIPRRVIAHHNNGFRLTNLGYDFLALYNFINSKIVSDLSNFRLIGTGKESDIYICRGGNAPVEKFGMMVQAPIVLKFHRLGRTSFKQVLNKREYKKGSKCSWIYMNRISASREYITMKALYEENIPTPVPIAQNRGSVVMEYVMNSYPLFKFSKAVLKKGAAKVLLKQATKILIDIAKLGLVHGDMNEFNLLVETNDNGDDTHVGNYQDDLPDDSSDENDSDCNEKNYGEESSDDNESNETDETSDDNETNESDEDESNAFCPYLNDDVNSFKLRVIDFPQVISRNNKTAQEIYTRDRNGLLEFFAKFIDINEEEVPPARLEDIERVKYVDVDLKAPGYPRKQDLRDNDLEYTKEVTKDSGDEDDNRSNMGREITVDDIKRNINKEQNKKNLKARISKQMRNSKKGQFRNDLKYDF